MKKIVSLVCVLALSVSVMAGCSSKSEETKAAETTADTTAETGAESTAAGDSGKLIMATEAGFAPYEYTEDGETVIGVDVDIANEIAKAMGKELVIQNIFLVHMELFSHQIQEKAVLIERLVQHSQNRLHVDLRI